MKHSDIYTKFMIEYDKANVTSSYPSLTKYEIATILDKAYLAIIAEKFTGNNPRGVAFEQDIKAIEDIRPLLKVEQLVQITPHVNLHGQTAYKIPNDFLYYVNLQLNQYTTKTSISGTEHKYSNVFLISSTDAAKFKPTPTNLPWVKNPVAYITENVINIIIDTYNNKYKAGDMSAYLEYVKKPIKFVGNPDDTDFELNDQMAEELINLAIIMATEIVESPRLQTKLGIKQLES